MATQMRGAAAKVAKLKAGIVKFSLTSHALRGGYAGNMQSRGKVLAVAAESSLSSKLTRRVPDWPS